MSGFYGGCGKIIRQKSGNRIFLWIDKVIMPPIELTSYVLTPVWFFGKKKTSMRKIQVVPQSQTAALPKHQEEEETDKTKQAQIEQTYEKH